MSSLLDWQRAGREQFCDFGAGLGVDERYLQAKDRTLFGRHIGIGRYRKDASLALTSSAKDGREDNSLLIGEFQLDHIFLAHNE